MTVSWDYYNTEKFDRIDDMYLPVRGEGKTMATQIVTAINKLVYKWYNDGDVYDNTYHLGGWMMNDLSSYANWLHKHTDENVQIILEKISDCYDSEYEDLLKELSDTLLDEDVLKEYNKRPAVGSIYDCEGVFRFEEPSEDDEEN